MALSGPLTYGISISFAGLSVLIILALLIANILLFRKVDKVSFSIKAVTFTANIAALCGSLMVALMMYNSYLLGISTYDSSNYMYIIALRVCVLFVRFPTCSIYLLRLYETFKGSVFKVATWKFWTMAILPCAYILVHVYNSVVLILHHTQLTDITQDEAWDIINDGNLVTIFLCGTTNVLLLIFFNSILFKVMNLVQDRKAHIRNVHVHGSHPTATSLTFKSTELSSTNLSAVGEKERVSSTITIPPTVSSPSLQRVTSMSGSVLDKSSPSPTSRTSSSLDAKEHKFMYVITRTAVLISAAIFFSGFSTLLFMIIHGVFREHEYGAIMSIFGRLFQCLYFVVEVLCAFLNYSANDTLYKRVCCGFTKCCHFCCLQIREHYNSHRKSSEN